MATTFLKVEDRAVGLLETTITDSATTIVLESGKGALFPSSGAFVITLEDEHILIDSRSTDTLTVNASGRGYNSTSAAAHTAGHTISLNIIAKHLDDITTAIGTLEADVPTFVAKGDIRYGSAAGTGDILSIGTDNYLLSVGTDAPVWLSPANVLADISPLTTRGDIMFRNATVSTRLAKGADNTILAMGANDPEWKTPAAILADISPLTTRGDIMFRNATISTRLAKGAANTILVMGADDPTWSATLAGLTLTSPTINGTIATTGLTLPAVTLGGTLTINSQEFSGALKTTAGITTGGATADADYPHYFATGVHTITTNQTGAIVKIAPTGAVTVPTGTAGYVASLALEEPNVTATGTATIAATLYIKDAPTEGSTNAALYVASGLSRFGGITATTGSFTDILTVTDNKTMVCGTTTIMTFKDGTPYLNHGVLISDTMSIETFINVNDYYSFEAWATTGAARAEVGRVVNAPAVVDCYFAMGGSQQNKFYYSGVVAFGGDLDFITSVDSAAVADQVSIGGYEISAGHRALAISSEEVVVTAAAGASDKYLPVRINGATFKLLLHS